MNGLSIPQPRDMSFQLFDRRTQIAAMREALFLRASLLLKAVMLAAQLGRLLFQRLMLGVKFWDASVLRSRSHHGKLCN